MRRQRGGRAGTRTAPVVAGNAAADNQRKKQCVKQSWGFLVFFGGLVLIWGSCYVWRPAWLVSASAWRSGPAAGMRQFRAGNEPFRSAGAAPVTRVFSPYVVQAGSARPRVRAGLPRQRSTAPCDAEREALYPRAVPRLWPRL